MVRRRLLAIALATPLVLAAAAVALRGPAVRWAGARALERAGARLGMPVTATAVEPEGWLGVRFSGVRVGPPGDPLLTVAVILVHLDADALLERRIAPHRIELVEPVVHVAGDGTPEGALRRLAARLRGRAGGTGGPGGFAAADGPRPLVLVRDAGLVDRAGGLGIEAGALTMNRDGRLAGLAHVVAPPLGECRLEAELGRPTPRRARARCARPYERTLPRMGRLVVREVALERSAEGDWLSVRGARLTRAAGRDRLPAPLVGARVDARVRLDGEGERPVEVSLAMPGGAGVFARGRIGRRRAALRADLDGVGLDGVHPALGGRAAGHVELHVDRDADRAAVAGTVTLASLRVTHPALSTEPVGPTTVRLEGRVEVERLTPTATQIRLAESRCTVGEVRIAVEGEAVIGDGAPRFGGRLEVAPVEGARLAAAIPPGLLPHLQPLDLEGRFGLRAEINVDAAEPDATHLEVDLDIDDLRVTRLNPRIRFDRLRQRFETRFEMPDGQVLRRVTGPGSERWTPIEAMPALLPAAVIAQEDGGFFRHGGVSLLHLRGSLARNLREGRFARGGSTLTMQLARNLFLHRRKTLSRKLEEIVLAWLLERNFDKTELLTLYLNVVEFGPGIFGIGDAARHYFGKAPMALTPTEVVFLVRLLPSPRRYYYQFQNRSLDDYFVRWMNRLLDLLLERGHLSPAEHAAADPEALWSAATTP